jgi:HD-GYP domain-containing protein (c-di-GMP phosphodiesterase class II)
MHNPFQIIERSHLALKLTPISIRELLFINDTPCDIYGLKNGLFSPLIGKNSFINKNILKELIEKGQVNLFVYHDDRQELVRYVQNSLGQISRSLSVGNPLDKARRLLNLLTITMSYLYQNPTDDELLAPQVQSAKNLAYFLLNNFHLHEPLYREYKKQKHHYIYSQPLISSILTLGVLKYSGLFNDSEIEGLFITSYFKDIGMSAIPIEKYDQQEELDQDEKILLAGHAQHSAQILKGRGSFTPQQLAIIENHHSFSLLPRAESKTKNEEKEEQADRFITGVESMIISTMDIIAAMTNERPYRKAANLFEALELNKKLIAERYPQEFRIIVSYFKSTFFNK